MAKKNTTTNATAKTATATVIEPAAFAALLSKLQKVQGWTVKGAMAEHSKGDKVAVARNGKAVVISNGRNNTRVAIHDALTTNELIKAIVDFQARMKGELKTKPVVETTEVEDKKQAAQPAKPNTKQSEGKTMAKTATATATPKTDKKNAATANGTPKPDAPAKVIGKKLVNPAGKATPVFDQLKKNVETDKKAKAQLESMWENFGKAYDFKVGNLTKALLAEGLWPAATDKAGDFKADENGNQVPVGYQKVYKEEREKDIKGIGHMVNTAAASFGRYNMQKAQAEALKNDAPTQGQGATASDDTPDEKAINRKLLQLEKLVNQLPVDVVKEWIENSKNLKPALDMYMEEAKALEQLED